jgi:hypothetical protein
MLLLDLVPGYRISRDLIKLQCSNKQSVSQGMHPKPA